MLVMVMVMYTMGDEKQTVKEERKIRRGDNFTSCIMVQMLYLRQQAICSCMRRR